MPINKKEAEVQAENIFNKLLTKEILVSDILEAITAKEDSVRYPHVIALELLSEKHPEMLYPEWDFFVKLLKSDNAFHRSTAVIAISNLTKVDVNKKFEDSFEDFFSLIDDRSVVVTRKLAIYAGRIANYKPLLANKIKDTLLGIDKTQHNSSRKDLIKGDIIETISEFFEEIENKEEVIIFVKKQLSSSSPSTIKKVKSFLLKWNME